MADALAGVRARRVGPGGSLLRVVVQRRGTVAHGLVGGAHTGDEGCEPQADHADGVVVDVPALRSTWDSGNKATTTLLSAS